MRKGRAAERVVADLYAARGFLVLGHNLRLGALEVDLLVRKGALVVAVEVRARRPGALVSAFASVGAKKRQRLGRAVRRLWWALRGDAGIERLRLDVVAVDLWSTPVGVEVAEAIG